MKKLIHIVDSFPFKREFNLIKVGHKFLSSQVKYTSFEIYFFLLGVAHLFIWLVIKAIHINPVFIEFFDYESLYSLLEFKFNIECILVWKLIKINIDMPHYTLFGVANYLIYEFFVRFVFCMYLYISVRFYKLIQRCSFLIIPQLKWSLLCLYYYFLLLFTLITIFFCWDLHILKYYHFFISDELICFLSGNQPWSLFYTKVSDPSKYCKLIVDLNISMKEWPRG